MTGRINVDESTSPSARPVAVDTIGGDDYQIVKLAIGAAGDLVLIPSTGMPVSASSLPLPAGASSETTLAALKGVTDSLLTAAQAIQTAAASLDGKTTAMNTGAIGGTVGLDFATLSALESINANTGLVQPVTDAQLRASAVPVSASALPLPAGAASEATLASANTAIGAAADTSASSDGGTFSLIALVKRLLAKFGTGQATMANSRPVTIASDQSAIPVSGSISAATEFWASVMRALENITDGPQFDAASGRLRVMLDPLGGAQTLGTVTTCSTLTTMSQIGGVPANSTVYDLMDAAWAQCIRPRIT